MARSRENGSRSSRMRDIMDRGTTIWCACVYVSKAGLVRMLRRVDRNFQWRAWVDKSTNEGNCFSYVFWMDVVESSGQDMIKRSKLS